MALLQLYYTSCEHGLSGYAGFQFNAVSQGVDARLMREVEQLTGYQRPPDVRPGEEPVNLCHLVDATGVAVTAQVVYTGKDPSGRPGNYFAHALATDDPSRDLDGLRPVELWGSSVWSTVPVTGTTELPVLDCPPEPGPVDRVTVGEHVGATEHGERTVACLLTGAVEAMAGGRPVVLRGASPEQNALWIAAICYLLDDEIARRVSFVTYASRADRSRVMVIGTIPGPESDAVTAALGGGFAVVDTVDAVPPTVTAHPAAALLAAAGPIRAAGLWSEARQLATGTETGLDAWHPVLAAAQAFDGRGRVLASDELDAVAAWLVERTGAAPRPLSAARTSAVLRVVLERSVDLGAQRLRSLAYVAESAGDPRQLDAIEADLLGRAVDALGRGEVPDPATDPVTDRGRAAAVGYVPELLGRAGWSGVLDVLEWGHRTRLDLPRDDLYRSAGQVLGPALEELDVARLAGVCAESRDVAQVVLAGLADHLAAGDGRRAARVLKGEVGRLLDQADLSRHPKLREYIVVDLVRTGEVAPTTALAEITELRGAGDPPLRDAALLAALWPKGSWRLDEANAFVGRVDGGDRPAFPYLRPALVEPPVDDADLDAWLGLVAAADARQLLAKLPAAERDRLGEVQQIGRMLAEAEPAATHEREWFRAVEQAVGKASPVVRSPLNRHLARLVLRVERPATALAGCDELLFSACREEATTLLARDPREIRAAGRLLAAAAALVGSRYTRFAVEVVAPGLVAWSGKDRRALRKQLAGRPVPEKVSPPQKERPADKAKRSEKRSGFRLPNPFRRPPSLADLLDDLIEGEQQRSRRTGSGRR